MKKSVPFWLLVLLVLISLSDVKGYPKLNSLRDRNSHRQKFEDLSWRAFEQLEGENDRTLRREAALQKIQEVCVNDKLQQNAFQHIMLRIP